MVLGIFEGIQFVLDSSSFTYVPFKKKQELRKQITDNGGIISYILTKKSNFVLTADGKRTLSSYKGNMAMNYGIPVVHMDFVADCVRAGNFLDPTPHVVANGVQEKGFSSGKISAGMEVKKKKNHANKTIKTDLENQRMWVYKDPNGPQYPEKDYKIAKDMVLKKTDENGEITQFFAIELHIVPPSVPCESPRYRIFTHHGSLNLLKCNDKDDQIFKECYFSYSVEEAMGIYVALYDKIISPPYSFERAWSFLSYKIGSDKMKERCIDVQESSDGIPPILEVTSLVDYLWKEAVGGLSDTLAVPVESLKLQAVQEAEAVLVSLKECLDKNNPDENEVKALWKEFCQLVPHEDEDVVFEKSLIAEKQNLCQLIRDILTVSESTSMSRVSRDIAKYKALHCHIEHLHEEEEEFQRIKETVVSSLTDCSREFRVLNIFSLYRPVEENNFTHHLDNKRLLYHSSRVNNFVGILSRGLLLPKIVVDDLGGKRSDPGMLGSGIYFGSSASTSVKYSARGSGGSRFMLINEVALGRSKRYRHFDKELTTAPEGYDSTHGVGESSQETSDFKDDEFVIYNTNQQRMRYLVEFSLDAEYVRKRHIDFAVLSNLDQEHQPSPPLQPDEDVDLTDVTSVADPISRVEAGLKGTGDQPVPLQAVHIRAKLLDLVAQVVVLQSYKNNSTVPIEAKYVFPLDDMAAVSGFEAFINGKHIIGEVKEKEQARKEYREAISQGHGAYLMDEEAPDVFTVSVGNLPSNANVLIKITYVVELALEDEKISFSLPGSVAPWKRSQALDDVTQTDVHTVRIEEETNTTIQVAIEMPFDIRSIESPTHAIRIKRTATKAVVELEPGHVMGDGFQLVIGLAEIHVPRMWVESHETKHGSEAGMLVFYPEFEAKEPDEVEVLFCLDASCSMKGSNLKEAKKILQMCINFLPDNWLFNIVVFGSYHSELFINSQQKTSRTVALASAFIKSLAAQKGGTELWRVLESLSLIPSMTSTVDHPRNVLIISDGHVTEESTTLALVRQGRSNCRVFTLGVGSTSNRHMLRALAQAGAGASEFFNSKAKSKWERKVKAQLFKAGQPGLTSVSVTWQQHDSNAKAPIQAPHEIVSLFSGSRLVVYGLVSNCTQAFLTAEVNGREISTMVSTSDLNITRGKILHQLVARGLIKDWEEGNLDKDHTKHEIAKRDTKSYIISISKEFSIVSQFTSFIAVEKREKDEKFEESLGPSIQELVADEDVDIIPYVSWEEGRPPMTHQKEPTTDEKVLHLLAKAKKIENVSVLQAEDLYKRACDLVVEQRRDCSRVVSARAFLELSNFYSTICHDNQKGSAMIDLLRIFAEEGDGDIEEEELLDELNDIFDMETLRDICKSPLHPRRSLILEIFPASDYRWLGSVVDDYESTTTESTESSSSESDVSFDDDPPVACYRSSIPAIKDEENLDKEDVDYELCDELYSSAIRSASVVDYENIKPPTRSLKNTIFQQKEEQMLYLDAAYESLDEELELYDGVPMAGERKDDMDRIGSRIPHSLTASSDEKLELYDYVPMAGERKDDMDRIGSRIPHSLTASSDGEECLGDIYDIPPVPSYGYLASIGVAKPQEDSTVKIKAGLLKKRSCLFRAEAPCLAVPDDRQEIEPSPSVESEEEAETFRNVFESVLTMHTEVEDQKRGMRGDDFPVAVSGDIEMKDARRTQAFGGGEFSFSTNKQRMVDRAPDESKSSSRIESASSVLSQTSKEQAHSPIHGRRGFSFGPVRKSEGMLESASGVLFSSAAQESPKFLSRKDFLLLLDSKSSRLPETSKEGACFLQPSRPCYELMTSSRQDSTFVHSPKPAAPPSLPAAMVSKPFQATTSSPSPPSQREEGSSSPLRFMKAAPGPPPRPPRMNTFLSTFTPFGQSESTPSTSVDKPVPRIPHKLAMKPADVKTEQPISQSLGIEPPSPITLPPSSLSHSPTSPAIRKREIGYKKRLLSKVELEEKHMPFPRRTRAKGTHAISSSEHVRLQPRSTPRIEEFFNLQNAEGYWTMDAAVFSSVGLDTNKCIAILQDAGAMSLGGEVFNEIVRFFATLVMLFVLRSRFPAMFSFPLNPLGKAASGVTQQWKEHISKAFYWLKAVNKKNPSLCWRLELGNDWELAANLLHSHCIKVTDCF